MRLAMRLLKWIIYPAMLRGVRRRWEKTFNAGAGGQSIAAGGVGDARATQGKAL